MLVTNLLEKSYATDSPWDFLVPEGLSYLSFQKAAIEYALYPKNVLIADPPGSGKTVMASGIINNIFGIQAVLVICPSFLKINWKRELDKWLVQKRSTEIVSGQKTEFPLSDIVIINYELLKHHRSSLYSRYWDLVIIDEAHKLKSKNADRTREVFGGIKREDGKIVERIRGLQTERCLALTGTPALNGKPKELWTLIQALDSEGLGSDWFSFAKRYCKLEQFQMGDRKVTKWDGAENLEELQQRMRSSFMIRREKKDILKNLPPKTRQIVPLEPGTKKLKKLLAAESAHFDEYVAKFGEDIPPDAFGEFATKMRETGLETAKAAIEIIAADLEDHNKIVVFTYHKDVAEFIHNQFKNNAALVTGDTAMAERQFSVDCFQSEHMPQMIVATQGSLGVGVTLTAAHLAIFVERSFVPGEVEQAEDRLHRIGAEEPVLIKHVVLEGGAAERQCKILLAKQIKIDKMIGSSGR